MPRPSNAIAAAKRLVKKYAGKPGRKPQAVAEAQKLLDEAEKGSAEKETLGPKGRKTAKKADEQVIKIPPIRLKTMTVTLVGTSGLMVNRFDPKMQQQIEDDYQGKARNKAAVATPEEQYRRSLYVIDERKKLYGIPAGGIKNCAVAACRFVEGINMTIARGAFHIEEGINGLIPVKSKEPTMDKRLVRVGPFGNKKPATRYRAMFKQWECSFNVTYNEGVITAEQLLNLFENAGFSVGLCEFRPEKNGSLGMFRVKRKA